MVQRVSVTMALALIFPHRQEWEIFPCYNSYAGQLLPLTCPWQQVRGILMVVKASLSFVKKVLTINKSLLTIVEMIIQGIGSGSPGSPRLLRSSSHGSSCSNSWQGIC